MIGLQCQQVSPPRARALQFLGADRGAGPEARPDDDLRGLSAPRCPVYPPRLFLFASRRSVLATEDFLDHGCRTARVSDTVLWIEWGADPSRDGSNGHRDIWR